MNDNAKRWVAALRSGEYDQTTGRLERDGAYCCLGVACLVTEYEATPWQGRISLPSTVAEELGLSSMSGHYLLNGEQSYLSNDNDNGMTFEQIADLIESEPEGLFVA